MKSEQAQELVTLRQACKEYPALPEPMRVLHNVDLTVRAGERMAIIGPSGCGKSTLLNLMGTLDTPSSGAVLVHGTDTSKLSPAALARVRNRTIGFVFQFHHLLPQCTVLENVLVPALVAGAPTAARKRGLSLLERVGLGGRADARPGQLSGGERQRVAVVRALINCPDLLLADEPTGSLNEEGAEALADLLLALHEEEQMALVVVTHSMALAARMGRVLELRHGALSTRE